MRVVDDRGADIIAAFRPVPTVGGACIVANLPYADALVPIHQLGRQFVAGSVAFIRVHVLDCPWRRHPVTLTISTFVVLSGGLCPPEEGDG